MSSPLVSICCVTFNHIEFIDKTIEGFLSQQTNFNFEIIVNDDCSNDGTRELLLKYKEKHPNIFNLILHDDNKWSQGVRGIFARYTFPEAKGKYIAMCEGDDYWTDPLKLQKQVDFLEENQEYGLTCGGFESINHDSEKTTWLKDITDIDSKFDYGFDIEIERFWNDWCIQTLTVLFRRELFSFDGFFGIGYKFPIDVHLYYYIIRQKKGFYFKEIMGVMNISNEGLYSHKIKLDRLVLLYQARKDLFKKHKEDKFLKSKFFNVTSELFVNKGFIKKQKDLNRRTLFSDMLYSIQSFNDFKHVLKCLVTPKKISAA